MYVVYTKNLKELASQLEAEADVQYVQKDYKSSQSELPKAIPSLPQDWDMTKVNGQFNDPKLSRQWTFKNSERGGISVTRPIKQEELNRVKKSL